MSERSQSSHLQSRRYTILCLINRRLPCPARAQKCLVDDAPHDQSLCLLWYTDIIGLPLSELTQLKLTQLRAAGCPDDFAKETH